MEAQRDDVEAAWEEGRGMGFDARRQLRYMIPRSAIVHHAS